MSKKIIDTEIPRRDLRGSGSDKNSDTSRLSNPENYQDKVEEDTFPASDAPSHSPLTGIGRTYGDTGVGQIDQDWDQERRISGQISESKVPKV